MSSSPLWPMVRAEREQFADLLEGLTPDQWQAPSLCAGWSVHDVVAHCISTAHTTPGSFLSGIVMSGFSFAKFATNGIARHGAGGPAQLIAASRASASRTNAPPGPTQTPLSEILVHSQDVATPLGITHAHDPQALVTSLDFYQDAQPLIGAKKRVAGLRLEATDVPWSYGEGPTVSGPAVSLLQAMSGRRAGLAGLSGDGVAALTARCP